MPKLIAIDPGHGPETPGKRTPTLPDGRQIQEYQFNVPTARFLEAALERCGFHTLLTADGTTDVPLDKRVEAANTAKADAFISIHYNALRGVWDETEGGVETHHYPGSAMGQHLAGLVQKYVALGTPQISRGVKSSNFYVLRQTKMTAILVENGFMDVRREAALMLDPKFQQEQAEQIAQGICEFFGAAYRPAASETPAVPGTAPAAGTPPVPGPVPGVPEAAGTPILHAATAMVEQAGAWAQKRGGTQTFVDLASIFWRLAPQRGAVDPAVAYAQSAKETAFGRFGGVVDATFHNTAGIKVSSGGGNADPNAHQRFASWDEGITAQLDHLALYAGAPGYPRQDTPDPRHFPYIKGKAVTVETLGGTWAPAEDYGRSIVIYLNELKNTSVTADPTVPAQPPSTNPVQPPSAGQEQPPAAGQEQLTDLQQIIIELEKQIEGERAKRAAAEQELDDARQLLGKYRDYFKLQQELRNLP